MARARSRVSRVSIAGPLAPFAGAYERELRRRSYTPLTVVPQLRQLARLSGWLRDNGFGVAELNVELVEDFLAAQRDGERHRSQWSRPGLLCVLDVLRELGVTAVGQQAAMSPVDALIAAFEGYLVAERGLAAGTIRGYCDHARRFVGGLPGGADLAGVRAAEVTVAVLRESAAVSVSATQYFVAGLRSFLRFCFTTGLMESDLSKAVLAATGRRSSPLPRGIGRDNAKALLGCCDRRTAVGRRDHAMIVTLLRLGLRRAELAGLALEDIDWRGASSWCTARAIGSIVCRCRGRWVRRSPATCGGAVHLPIAGKCSCVPGHRMPRLRPARSPRRCAARAAARD
jgi:integrase/recombinase XerD